MTPRRGYRRGWPSGRGTLAALLMTLSGAGGALAEEARSASTDTLYTTSLKNLQDQPQTLEAYKGRVSVVYFWATWCAPCQLETPKLVRLYDRFKDRGVVVIGIALDNADKVRAFTKKMGVDYPTVYGGTSAIQIGRDLGNDVGAVPFTVIIDKAGHVVETIKGDTPDGRLESIIAPLAG